MPISTSLAVNITAVSTLANTSVAETPTPNNSVSDLTGKVAIQFSTLNSAATKTAGVDAYMISGVPTGPTAGTLYFNAGGGTAANNLIAITNTTAVDFSGSTLNSGITLQFRSSGLWAFDASTGVSTKLSGSDTRLYWVPPASSSGATDAFQIRAVENINNVFDTTDRFSTQEVMVKIDVPATNDAPDLSGAPAPQDYTEQTGTLNLAALGITLADPDVGAGVMKLKFTAVDGQINYGGALAISSGASGTASIEVQGTLAQLQALLGGTGGALTYSNSKDAPSTTDSITVLVDDANTGLQGAGGAKTDSLVIDVNITQVNDAPVITATAPATPRVLNLTSNTQIRIQDIQISDVDVGSGDVSVTLAASAGAGPDGREGSIALFTPSPSGVTVDSSNGTLKLTGSLANVNAALADGVVYTGDDGFDGQTILSIDASDTGTPGTANATQVQLTINGAPTVESVTHSLGVPDAGGFNGTGWHGEGDILSFTVNMSAIVNVAGGTPSLALTIGSTVVQANLASGSGSNALVFEYTIPALPTVLTDTNGIVVGAINLNGSTIQSTSGTNAILTLNNVETTATVNVDNTPPAAPTLVLSIDSGISTSDFLTNDGEVTVNGLEVGATAQYFNSNLGEWETLTLSSGAFDMTDGDGSYSFEIRQLDRAGNPSPSVTINFDLDTQAPVFVTGGEDGYVFADLDNDTDNGITGTDEDNVTNDNNPLIAFQGEDSVNFAAGDRIQYELDGSGTWVTLSALDTSNESFSIPGLTQGDHVIIMRMVDAAGNASATNTFNFTFDSTAPASPTGTLALTADSTNSAAPGYATDMVTNNGEFSLAGITWEASTDLLKQYSLDAGATWTDIADAATVLDPTTADGVYNVTLRQVDRAGNASTATTAFTYTLDKTAPIAGSIDLVNSSDSAGVSQTDDITNDLTPTLQFNFGADVRIGDVIKLYSSTDGGVTKNLINTFAARAVDGAGSVSFTPGANMLEGAYTFYASIEDKAGNKAAVDAELAVTLDRTAPSVPTLSLAVASDTGSSDNDRITNDTTPSLRISLANDVVAGDLVFLRQGVTELFPAGVAVTAGNITDGYIDVTVPAIVVPPAPETGTQYNFQVAIEDIAGNRSSYSPVTEVTIDVTPPGDLSTAVDLESEDSDSSLYDDPSLPPGSGLLSTTTDNITNDNAPSFTVSLALAGMATPLTAGAQIQLFRDGTTEISDRITLTAADVLAGEVTIDLTENTFLDDGEHTITAKAYDRAGNASLLSSPDLDVTIDTAVLAPTDLDLDASTDSAIDDDNVTNINAITLTVASTEGDDSLVQFFDDQDNDGIVDGGESLGVALVAGGSATLTTGPLSDATYNIRAVGVDRAGNVSTATDAMTVVVDTDGPDVDVLSSARYDTGSGVLTITAQGMQEDFLLATTTGLPGDNSGFQYSLDDGMNWVDLLNEDIESYEFVPSNNTTDPDDSSITLKITLTPTAAGEVASVLDSGLASGLDLFRIQVSAITDLAGNSMSWGPTTGVLVMDTNNPPQPTENIFSVDVYGTTGEDEIWYDEKSDAENTDFVTDFNDPGVYWYDSGSGDQIFIDGVSAADTTIFNSDAFIAGNWVYTIQIEDGEDTNVDYFSTRFATSDTSVNWGMRELNANDLDGSVVKFADGSVYMSGEDGADNFVGGMGDDHLIGGEDGDTLIGLSGDDRLSGGEDNDLIIGGRGDDIIWGGEDNDILTGGTGADQFVYDGNTSWWAGEDGQDAITDFDITKDTLVFTGLDQAGAEQLLADGIQSGDDTILVIDHDYGAQTIRLLGIDLADLSATNVVGTNNFLL